MHVRGLLIIMNCCISNILLAISFGKQFITFLKKSFLFSWIQLLKKISVRCYYQLIYKNSILPRSSCICFLSFNNFFDTFVVIYIFIIFQIIIFTCSLMVNIIIRSTFSLSLIMKLHAF